MLRFGRVAPLVATLAVAMAACGGSDTGSSSGSSGTIVGIGGGGGDGGSGIGPNGQTIKSNSRSCTGGAGADTHCGGGAGGDETQLGSTDCCESRFVSGGSYNRFNDADFPATVSSFYLDSFLVTAGRFRAWVTATNGNLNSSAPAAGAGANPHIANSGWKSEWNIFLPTNMSDVNRMLGPELDTDGFLACQYGTDIDSQGALTWFTPQLDSDVKTRNKDNASVLAENTQEALDRKPINCIPWYVLFAFCIWDGGRLPTDAEFQFAKLGGSEQREYAWGNIPDKDNQPVFADRTDLLAHAPIFDYGKPIINARLWDKTINDGSNTFEDNYGLTWGDNVFGDADNASHIMPVGRRPAGNGKWGQSDLNGGMFEWMLDEGPIVPGQCKDCANLNYPAPSAHDTNPALETNQPEFKNMTDGGEDWWRGGARSIEGSAWDNAVFLSNKQSKSEISYYTDYPVLRTYRSLGGRCARDL